MKKQILKFGKGLSKAEQKVIHGGDAPAPCRKGVDMDKDCLCTENDQCHSNVCSKEPLQIFGNCA